MIKVLHQTKHPPLSLLSQHDSLLLPTSCQPVKELATLLKEREVSHTQFSMAIEPHVLTGGCISVEVTVLTLCPSNQDWRHVRISKSGVGVHFPRVAIINHYYFL